MYEKGDEEEEEEKEGEDDWELTEDPEGDTYYWSESRKESFRPDEWG